MSQLAGRWTQLSYLNKEIVLRQAKLIISYLSWAPTSFVNRWTLYTTSAYLDAHLPFYSQT